MSKKKEDLKILYIQIRDDDETKQEELDEFVRFSGLLPEQFTVLNVFETPEFDPERADGFDAVFVGGSSDASVMKAEKYPFVASTKKLLARSAEMSRPVFASCFGFQVAVDALGGRLTLDPRNIVNADEEINKTVEAKNDPVFRNTPDSFYAISFHNERADELPTGAILLAHSKTSPFQAFKLDGKPFYAFQFHPEIDRQDLVNRITRYIDRYYKDGNNDGTLQHLIDTCHEVPEANKLLRNFVDNVLLSS